MKTTQFHKISATVFLMAVLSVAAVNPAFAQRRTRKYQPERREHSKGKYENRDHGSSDRERNNRNERNDDRFKKNNHNRDRDHERNYAYHTPRYNRDNDRNWNRNKHWNNNRHWNKNKRWDNDRRWHREHPVYVNHRHYRIPRYNGRVRVYARAPWGRRHPMVIRHKYGDIYCFGGNFYTYYPKYGYVQIQLPRDMVFATIPRGAVRVRVNGHLMFRLGDVYFELGSRGYRIANYHGYPEMYGYVDRY